MRSFEKCQQARRRSKWAWFLLIGGAFVGGVVGRRGLERSLAALVTRGGSEGKGLSFLTVPVLLS